jgi:hypothetical protein
MLCDMENADLFDGFGNGSLHMYVVCSPGWEPYKEGDARYLDLDFHYADWEALFMKALGAHAWQLLPDGNYPENYDEQQRIKFHESIPEFPHLRTIYDMYEDYSFDIEEAQELRDECTRLKKRLNDELAIKAVRKIIYGCNQAIEAKCNLMFVCD